MKNRGQSTIELALILPILAGFLVLIIKGFKVNHGASEDSVEIHAKTLAEYNDGNGVLEIDGVRFPAGEYIKLIPSDPDLFQALGDSLQKMAISTVADLGLNQLFSKLPFFQDSTYFSGAIQGGISAGLSSFIDSGFRKVDSERAAWGAAQGALSSQEATEDFQGARYKSSGFREAFGSGFQNSAVAYSQGQGSWEGAFRGAVGGLLHSDTSRNFVESENRPILKGAARGAIESTVAGAFQGKVQLRAVAIGTGMGAWNTNKVAQAIPLSKYSGQPRQAASFRAINGALSSYLHGGSNKDALFSATSEAFYSGQSMKAIAGESEWRAAGAGAAFGAGTAWLQGQDGRAVGIGALQSMVHAPLAARNPEFFQRALRKSPTLPGVLEDPEITKQAVAHESLTLQRVFQTMEPVLPWVFTYALAHEKKK